MIGTLFAPSTPRAARLPRGGPGGQARNSNLESPATPINAQTLAALLSYGPTWAGVDVNQTTALTYSTVFSCIRVLAESIMTLPFVIHERTPAKQASTEDGAGTADQVGGTDPDSAGGRMQIRPAESHPAYELLRHQPNEQMTAPVFKEVLQGHVVSWGNGYARIEFNGAGKPKAVWPMHPGSVEPIRQSGKLRYRVTVGSDGGGYEWYYPEEVLHIPGLSPDGFKGYSPIYMARQAISLGLAAEQFGAAFFGNGAAPSGVLEHPSQLSAEAALKLRESFERLYAGARNSHRTAVLEEGMKYHPISIPPEDAQFLQTRKFQKLEICAVYRVPPHMVGDLERATHSNIEHQALEFVMYTLRPWLVKWCAEVDAKLLGLKAGERGRYFTAAMLDDLLMVDTSTRFNMYQMGIQSGVVSVNEARLRENMNGIRGGDLHLRPQNMAIVETGQPVSTPPGSAAGGGGQKVKGPGGGGPGAGGKPATAGGSGDGAEGKSAGAPVGADRAALGKATCRLIADAMGRMLRREANAARRWAAKPGSPAEFQRWLGEFMAEQRGLVAGALTPAAEAALDVAIPGCVPELRSGLSAAMAGIATAVAADYVRRAGVELTAAYAAGTIEQTSRGREAVEPAVVAEGMSEWVAAVVFGARAA